MSDSISAWVDKDEMRRLAESLLSRPFGHELDRLEVDFGSQFEGFAREVQAEPTRESAPVAPTALPPAPAASPVETTSQAAVQPASARPVFSETEAPAASPKEEVQVAPSSPAVEASSTNPSPSVMRSAVQFLKKAQAEGRAGGVIRSARPTPPPSVSPDAGDEAVSVSSPPVQEARPIHSPFRRVSDIESKVEEAQEPIAAPSHPPISVNKLKRPPAPSGDDPILARVIQFGKWLKGPVGVRNFFVSNSEGKILIDELSNQKLIQVARSLAGASGSGSSGESELGSLHVRIGEDSILEVVPTPSQFGILILGLVVEHPLPEDLIHEIRKGLEEVANARLIRSAARRS
ncbi:hypothetical protein AAFN60_15660 [Roseibacillus persicicus]|uniref:hypothetical protein n=1 Tax=Roseibacillus persicicus TaxID=454148 RepID=UPI00398B8DB0